MAALLPMTRRSFGFWVAATAAFLIALPLAAKTPAAGPGKTSKFSANIRMTGDMSIIDKMIDSDPKVGWDRDALDNINRAHGKIIATASFSRLSDAKVVQKKPARQQTMRSAELIQIIRITPLSKGDKNLRVDIYFRPVGYGNKCGIVGRNDEELLATTATVQKQLLAKLPDYISGALVNFLIDEGECDLAKRFS
jgi:hypothetical protein